MFTIIGITIFTLICFSHHLLVLLLDVLCIVNVCLCLHVVFFCVIGFHTSPPLYASCQLFTPCDSYYSQSYHLYLRYMLCIIYAYIAVFALWLTCLFVAFSRKILSFLILRNIPGFVRTRHSSLFVWFGGIWLEVSTVHLILVFTVCVVWRDMAGGEHRSLDPCIHCLCGLDGYGWR